MQTINLELAFADLEVVERKIQGIPKAVKSHNKEISSKAKMLSPVLEKLKNSLEDGIPARKVNLDDDEVELIRDLQLITLKKMIYLCNVDEDGMLEDTSHVLAVKKMAKDEGAEVLKICGKLESEIAVLDTDEEKVEFMEAAGIEESGLDKLTKVVYHMLGYRTYFTAGEKEVRAWTFKDGAKAPEAAGVIHTDFEKGFIKAEVFHYDDLVEYHSEAKVKEAGKLRLEGKEYVVQDGDVMHFKFNV